MAGGDSFVVNAVDPDESAMTWSWTSLADSKLKANGNTWTHERMALDTATGEVSWNTAHGSIQAASAGDLPSSVHTGAAGGACKNSWGLSLGASYPNWCVSKNLYMYCEHLPPEVANLIPGRTNTGTAICALAAGGFASCSVPAPPDGRYAVSFQVQNAAGALSTADFFVKVQLLPMFCNQKCGGETTYRECTGGVACACGECVEPVDYTRRPFLLLIASKLLVSVNASRRYAHPYCLFLCSSSHTQDGDWGHPSSDSTRGRAVRRPFR